MLQSKACTHIQPVQAGGVVGGPAGVAVAKVAYEGGGSNLGVPQVDETVQVVDEDVAGGEDGRWGWGTCTSTGRQVCSVVSNDAH